jgi:chromatin remodeling complex protein RSC6
MADTLALIKELHLRKLYIQEDIVELTVKKQNIEQQINQLILSIPPNKQRQPLRKNSLVSKFCTPTKISNELADFLNKERGTEMARNEITREINKYIRINNLEDKENKRNINPDAKISNLFNLNDADELTYFNLQRYISPHVTS